MVSPGSEARRRPAERCVAQAGGRRCRCVKIPELFGLRFPEPSADATFYPRNLSLFVLPFLAVFFALRRGIRRGGWIWLAVPFAAGGLIVNLLPFKPGGHTEALAAIHLPIALWLMVFYAYAGGRWRGHEQRELCVLGGGSSTTRSSRSGRHAVGLANFVRAIGHSAEKPSDRPAVGRRGGGLGAWLVEHKQSVIENMAPVLTWIFTPLFTALLLVFVASMIWTGNAIRVEREVLIGFDLLLVVVLGLLLYAISARDPQAPPGRFDVLQLVLAACALVVDALALWAMAASPSSGSAQQDGRPRPEPAASREPGLVGRALRAVPRPARPLRPARALADGLHASLRVLGLVRDRDFPGDFQLHVAPPPTPRPTRAVRPGRGPLLAALIPDDLVQAVDDPGEFLRRKLRDRIADAIRGQGPDLVIFTQERRLPSVSISGDAKSGFLRRLVTAMA